MSDGRASTKNYSNRFERNSPKKELWLHPFWHISYTSESIMNFVLTDFNYVFIGRPEQSYGSGDPKGVS